MIIFWGGPPDACQVEIIDQQSVVCACGPRQGVDGKMSERCLHSVDSAEEILMLSRGNFNSHSKFLAIQNVAPDWIQLIHTDSLILY